MHILERQKLAADLTLFLKRGPSTDPYTHTCAMADLISQMFPTYEVSPVWQLLLYYKASYPRRIHIAYQNAWLSIWTNKCFFQGYWNGSILVYTNYREQRKHHDSFAVRMDHGIKEGQVQTQGRMSLLLLSFLALYMEEKLISFQVWIIQCKTFKLAMVFSMRRPPLPFWHSETQQENHLGKDILT